MSAVATTVLWLFVVNLGVGPLLSSGRERWGILTRPWVFVRGRFRFLANLPPKGNGMKFRAARLTEAIACRSARATA